MAATLLPVGVRMTWSVDQELLGKHYRWGIHSTLLWREALIHKQLTKILEHKKLSEEIKKNLKTLFWKLTVISKLMMR